MQRMLILNNTIFLKTKNDPVCKLAMIKILERLIKNYEVYEFPL